MKLSGFCPCGVSPAISHQGRALLRGGHWAQLGFSVPMRVHPIQKQPGGSSSHLNLPATPSLSLWHGVPQPPSGRTMSSLEAQAGFGTVYLWYLAGDTSLSVLLVSVWK